jgi:hypothetical protein
VEKVDVGDVDTRVSLDQKEKWFVYGFHKREKSLALQYNYSGSIVFVSNAQMENLDSAVFAEQ